LRKITYTVFLTLSLTSLFAQINHDSIFHLADTVKSVSKKFDQITWAYRKVTLSNKETKEVITKLSSVIPDTNSKTDMANLYMAIATIFYGQEKYEEQIGFSFKCLKLAEKIKDTLLIIKANYDLGSAFLEIENVPFAKRHFFYAINYFFKETTNKEVERYKSNYFNQLGTIYKDQSQLDSALFYHKNALQIRLNLGYKKLIAASYNNLGLVYKKLKDYENALIYLKQSLEIKRQIDDKKGTAGTCINIGNLLTSKSLYVDALKYLHEGTTIANSIHDGPFFINGVEGIAACYFEKGDYKNAAIYYQRHKKVLDSLQTEGMNKQIAELSAQYESGKKDAELLLREEKLKNQQTEIKKQKLFTTSVVCVLGLVVLLIFFVYRSYRINKKNAISLERKNIIIEQKNKEITDSINYARRIQNSLLTTGSILEKNLPEHFILYRPKDIVSGDFYWFHPFEDKTAKGSLIAAADCTGHGVPGAFMSLIGKEKLDKAASITTSPGKILSFLNVNVKNALQQDSTQLARDGMDIALVRLELKGQTAQLKYAGANRPIWIIRNGTEVIEEIKATKHAIAGFTSDEQAFEEHDIELSKGDTFYIFSDGYADQFGGDKHKKLTTKTFKKLLISQQSKTLQQQETYYNEFIDRWMDEQEQIDDMLMIGIRV
jgi:serine phosphatase RsbU (regulator of sigma subunit)